MKTINIYFLTLIVLLLTSCTQDDFDTQNDLDYEILTIEKDEVEDPRDKN